MREFPRAEAPQHGFRHVFRVHVQVAQHRAPFASNADFDDTAIALATDAVHEIAPAQAVDKTRDVWIARDHPVCDLPAREPRRMAPPQNPQDVVLVGGEIGGGLEELLPWLHEACGRDPQAQEDLLLAGGEFALLLQCTGNDSRHVSAR